jgi:hypothetical protein
MLIDYCTPADRLGTSLAVKRAAAIAYLRSRGKYIADLGCNFVPTNAANTDVKATMWAADVEACMDRINLGVPSLMRRQAA